MTYVKIGGKKYELLKKEQKTVYIHINDTIKEYVPKYITKLKEIEVPVLPTKQDTLEILKDYYQNQNKYFGIDGVGEINEITKRLSNVFDKI